MARFIEYDYSQSQLIPVSFHDQIFVGSFEYTLCYLIDHEIDMSVFESRYSNDVTGRLAYDPRLLLKIVLYAYSKGITSSRQIEWCCRHNILFMALSADAQPHFTTIAKFISTCDKAVAGVFRDVLMVCDAQGLIGREMFAIDGVKLPSNASKEWSGTRADFEHKVAKIERAVERMLSTHGEEDDAGTNAQTTTERRAHEVQQIETLRAQTKKLREWLEDHDDKPGRTGTARKSNITDNDSAKMKTGHGVIQGYGAIATVDAKRQVVVQASASDEAEQTVFIKALEELSETFDSHALAKATVLSDSGFHSEKNVQYLFDQGIDAYIADNQFRKRDPRFINAKRYQSVADKPKPASPYPVSAFEFPADLSYCLCPAGKRLYRSGGNCRSGGYESVKFKGAKSSCGPCGHRQQCLRHPERTPIRQVSYFKGRAADAPETATTKMKRRIDSPHGRHVYSQRLGIVEPVFGNIRSTMGLNRFSLRGREKVNNQWQLFTLLHNMGKLHRYGWSA